MGLDTREGDYKGMASSLLRCVNQVCWFSFSFCFRSRFAFALVFACILFLTLGWVGSGRVGFLFTHRYQCLACKREQRGGAWHLGGGQERDGLGLAALCKSGLVVWFGFGFGLAPLCSWDLVFGFSW